MRREMGGAEEVAWQQAQAARSKMEEQAKASLRAVEALVGDHSRALNPEDEWERDEAAAERIAAEWFAAATTAAADAALHMCKAMEEVASALLASRANSWYEHALNGREVARKNLTAALHLQEYAAGIAISADKAMREADDRRRYGN
jgi:hypothetical protein